MQPELDREREKIVCYPVLQPPNSSPAVQTSLKTSSFNTLIKHLVPVWFRGERKTVEGW